ncbi:MAG: hypothetical protein ACYCPS_04645 [Candidatus Saccharimonadales bacterium]
MPPEQEQSTNLPPKQPAVSSEPVIGGVKKTRSRGLLLLLLVIVLIAASLFGGYYYEHNKATSIENSDTAEINDLNSKLITLQKENKTLSTSSKSNSGTTTSLTQASVTAFVNDFYNKYITAAKSTNSTQRSQLAQLVQQNGTAALVNYYTPPSGYSYPADPILCAQNIPTSMAISGVSVNTDNATGVATESFGASQPVKVNFSVINSSGNLKIDTITCSPALIPQKGA